MQISNFRLVITSNASRLKACTGCVPPIKRHNRRYGSLIVKLCHAHEQCCLLFP
jgi:hypothetical protein